jgi:hypothetical protein
LVWSRHELKVVGNIEEDMLEEHEAHKVVVPLNVELEDS